MQSQTAGGDTCKMSLTGCMQNLILNNMQPNVQSDDERGNRSTRLGSQTAFGFGGSHRL